MASPYLSRINYYPIKSLDGHTLQHAGLLPSGAIEYDRRFALFDAAGEVINGKRMASIHRLRCEFDSNRRFLSLRPPSTGRAVGFQLDAERTELEKWLGEYLGLVGPVRIEENDQGGFPDDVEAPGPTVISEATLQMVATWFPGLTVEEVRGRFRPNLEIGGVTEFWEDQLYAGADEVVEFTVGQAQLEGVYPCQRCVVPTRWSLTGEVGPDRALANVFAERRKQSLPTWADRGRFDHYYRLAVNTRSAKALPATIYLGDEVRVVGRMRKR